MIEKIVKHIKVLWKGVVGISIELAYPLITFSAAAALSFIIYLAFLVKR